MTDVLDKLIVCEIAEKKGQNYSFVPEIWGEARAEIERLRSCIKACLVDLTDQRTSLKESQRVPLIINRLKWTLGEKE